MDDDLIRKNPSNGVYREMKTNAPVQRIALTSEQAKHFLQYIESSPQYCSWLPLFVKMCIRDRDMGFDAFNVGPEAEFFLFKTDDEGRPTTQTNDEAGYFDLGPLDHGEGTRREIS